METEKRIINMNLDDILPNRFQPRIKFDEIAINELADSIKEHGVIQPIVVRPLGDKYEIIAGERRYKASILAGRNTIPAIVTSLDDKESAEIALIENVQRRDLTPIEEAVSYRKILDMGYLTQEQLALKLGCKQSTIANKLRLLNLDEEVQEALLDEKISERHARSLLKLNKPSDQKFMLQRIVKERLTVRRTDEEIAKLISGANDSSNDSSTKRLPKENANDSSIIHKNTSTNPFQLDLDKVELFDINEKKEDEKMNSNNNFNIPSTPIINDVPEKSNVTPTPSAPGFMDVDKIQKEAQDIYQQKPLANMENLLKPDATMTPVSPMPTPIVNEPIEIVEEPEEPRIPTGKFFSNLPVDEDETEETSTGNGGMNSIFNLNPFKNEAKEEPKVSANQIDAQAANMNFGMQHTPNPNVTTFNFENPFMQNQASSNQNVSAMNPMAQTNQQQRAQITNAPTMAGTPAMPQQGMKVPPMTQKPTPTVANPIPNSIKEADIESVDIMMEPRSQQEIKPSYQQPMPSSQPRPTSMQSQGQFQQMPPRPTQPMMNSMPNINHIPSSSPNSVSPSPMTPPPMPNKPTTMPERMREEPVRLAIDGQPIVESREEHVQNIVKADLKTVINTIRECAKRIEALGYKVDTDELDFENMYEVNFKILK